MTISALIISRPAVSRRTVAALAAACLLVAACGDERSATGTDRPTVAVTTSILGDVVENLVGDGAEVVTVMPVGADPHEFQASARQVDQVRGADALVVNGAGFEEGLLDVLDAASDDGVPTVEASPSGDPHFFTDPGRMAEAAETIADFLADEVPELAADDVVAAGEEYVRDLRELEGDIEALVSRVPEDDRVLVTNHDVFGAFAERYGFRVVGTVIPSASTGDAVGGGDLARLADVIAAEGVPAIFVDASADDQLASTLAEEAGGDVAVVQLFSESLGEAGSGADTYIGMVRSNAERIVDALARGPSA